MSRKYRNPPIVEALCEFRFDPGDPWDLAVPGLVYEELGGAGGRFPKRRQAANLEVELTLTDSGAQQQVARSERMQFLRGDEKVLVQIGPNLLAVNHLKPYSSWQEFFSLVRDGFETYNKVTKPKGVKRIGVRYINRVEIPEPSIRLEDFLEFRPYMGSNLRQEIAGPFVVGVHIPYEDGRDVLRLQLSSVRKDTPGMALMLDLDYFLAQPGGVPLGGVLEWNDVAHGRVEEVFEACITDRLRQLFDEVVE